MNPTVGKIHGQPQKPAFPSLLKPRASGGLPDPLFPVDDDSHKVFYRHAPVARTASCNRLSPVPVCFSHRRNHIHFSLVVGKKRRHRRVRSQEGEKNPETVFFSRAFLVFEYFTAVVVRDKFFFSFSLPPPSFSILAAEVHAAAQFGKGKVETATVWKKNHADRSVAYPGASDFSVFFCFRPADLIEKQQQSSCIVPRPSAPQGFSASSSTGNLGVFFPGIISLRAPLVGTKKVASNLQIISLRDPPLVGTKKVYNKFINLLNQENILPGEDDDDSYFETIEREKKKVEFTALDVVGEKLGYESKINEKRSIRIKEKSLPRKIKVEMKKVRSEEKAGYSLNIKVEAVQSDEGWRGLEDRLKAFIKEKVKGLKNFCEAQFKILQRECKPSTSSPPPLLSQPTSKLEYTLVSKAQLSSP
ncbi:hypothetical protein KSP40_PGU017700 [Platanthera guangdongensis]|uniref:Uncharacterized protein n=1 Tax=Platanthera guangdongensis TaxID=2320717 RepID=A0ABR2MXZ0_9ASPA